VFVFSETISPNQPTGEFGHDRILDFGLSGTSHDFIDFQGVFEDFADVLAHSQNVGRNVLITSDEGNSVLVLNVHREDFSSDHFIL